MKCVNKIKIIDENKLEAGDILIFSECCAFLLIETDIEFLAVQLLNNGNYDLGYVNYSNGSLEYLAQSLIKDYGNYILKKHMKDVNIDFDI